MYEDNNKSIAIAQTSTTQTTEKVAKIGILPQLISFTKKHRLVVIIAIVTIGVLGATFSLMPVISINKLALVNLGASVKLEIGQTVKLKNANVSVKIVHFTNDTCPKARTCFGSTMAVEYELSIDGIKHATGSIVRATGSAYQVETVSSDYKTYAIIKIMNSN